MSSDINSCRPITRLSIPTDNYLDPLPNRSNALTLSQSQNGRLSSIGSSSNGPISPQGTTRTSSLSPPALPMSLPPLPPSSSINPNSSSYANEEILQNLPVDGESNNSKKSMQR